MLLGTAAAFAFPPLDLTAGGTTVQSGVDGTVWRNTDLQQPAGTGIYDPFLRVQANDTEDGMNTDGNRVYDQVGGGDPHTHALLFGDLATTTVDSERFAPRRSAAGSRGTSTCRSIRSSKGPDTRPR